MRFDEVTIENDDKGTKWTAKQCQLLGSFEIELWIRLRDAKISSASTGKIVCFVYSANTNWKNFTMDGIVDLPIKSNLLQSKPGSNAECLRLLRSLVIRAVKRVAKKDPVLSTNLQRVMDRIPGDSPQILCQSRPTNHCGLFYRRSGGGRLVGSRRPEDEDPARRDPVGSGA
jgi:hypothetical protein